MATWLARACWPGGGAKATPRDSVRGLIHIFANNSSFFALQKDYIAIARISVNMSAPTSIQRLGFSIIFLLCGLVVSVFPLFLQSEISFVARIVITIGFLLAALWLRKKERTRKFFQAAFAFFIMSFCFAMHYLLLVSGWFSTATVLGVFVFQIVNASAIIVLIILLTKISGTDLSEIYVRKGRLSLGLLLGGGIFIAVLLLTLAFPRGISGFISVSEDLTVEKMLSLMPMLIVFVLSNGFREEFWFRAIFLKKYEPFIGGWSSNIVTALVFSLTHSLQEYTPFIPVLLGFTFLFGLAFGYFMQKTSSIIGPALFHAAMDIPVILGIFSFL